jgi:hypothetical protein
MNVDGKIPVMRELLDLKNIFFEGPKCRDHLCVSFHSNKRYLWILHENSLDWRDYLCE